MNNNFAVFCFNGYEQYYREFANAGFTLLKPDEYRFEEGDYFFSTSYDVKNKHIYILGSLNRDSKSSTNDRLARTLFFIDTLKSMGADKVTLIAPYTCYSRMDKYDIPANSTVAKVLAAAGLDAIVTLDAHNKKAFEDSFKIEAIALESHELFCDYYAALLENDNICIVSPDAGGVERARKLANAMEARLKKQIKLIALNKKREINSISMDASDMPNINGSTVIIYDDIISTGKTILAAADICKKHGATKVYGGATHLLNQDFPQNIGALDEFISTNSVPHDHNNIDITKILIGFIRST